MDTDRPDKQISTRKGMLLIALIITGITLVSLVRHWSQAEATSEGVVFQTEQGRQLVAIFTTDSCTYCAAAKQFFEEKKVAYTEFNLDRSEKARQVFGMLNGRGVPLIIVGKQRMVGFEPGMLGRVLKEQGFM